MYAIEAGKWYLDVGDSPSALDIDEKTLGELNWFWWVVSPLVGVILPRSLSEELSNAEWGLRKASSPQELPRSYPDPYNDGFWNFRQNLYKK